MTCTCSQKNTVNKKLLINSKFTNKCYNAMYIKVQLVKNTHYYLLPVLVHNEMEVCNNSDSFFNFMNWMAKHIYMATNKFCGCIMSWRYCHKCRRPSADRIVSVLVDRSFWTPWIKVGIDLWYCNLTLWPLLKANN